MAYTKQTWDTTSVFNPTRMNHIEQGIYDASVNENYSTTEQVVGTWTNGKPLYKKTIDCGLLPNNTTKSTSHSISNLSKIIKIEGFATDNNDTIPLPYINPLASNVDVSVYGSTTSIQTVTNSGILSGWNAYVTLYYTKTTD